jgi:hypothetical protein
MAVNEPVSNVPLAPDEERASKAIVTGRSAEVIGAGAGVVLSILALLGILTPLFASIALIVLGVALFFESAAVASNVRVISKETVSNRSQAVELVGGLSLAMIGAIAVVTLGILTLLGILPSVLLPVGVITVGAAAIFSGLEKERVGHFLASEFTAEKEGRSIVKYASMAPAGLELSGGVATVILGILALVGIHPVIMTLTGLLVASAAMFLSSAGAAGRTMRRITAH